MSTIKSNKDWTPGKSSGMSPPARSGRAAVSDDGSPLPKSTPISRSPTFVESSDRGRSLLNRQPTRASQAKPTPSKSKTTMPRPATSPSPFDKKVTPYRAADRTPQKSTPSKAKASTGTADLATRRAVSTPVRSGRLSNRISPASKENSSNEHITARPSTNRISSASRDNHGNERLISTPTSGKRTQNDRNITSSDERRIVAAQPQSKRSCLKYKEHVIVGQYKGSEDKVGGNIDANGRVILTRLRDSQQLNFPQVDFFDRIILNFVDSPDRQKNLLEPTVKKYIKAQPNELDQTRKSVGSASTERCGTFNKSPAPLELLNPSLSYRPSPQSPSLARDIHVGHHRRHYSKVYAFLKQGSVSFRFDQKGMNFRGGVNETLRSPEKQVQYGEIEFTSAYRGHDSTRVIAIIEASLRSTTGTLDLHRDRELPAVSGQEEDGGLFCDEENIHDLLKSSTKKGRKPKAIKQEPSAYDIESEQPEQEAGLSSTEGEDIPKAASRPRKRNISSTATKTLTEEKVVPENVRGRSGKSNGVEAIWETKYKSLQVIHKEKEKEIKRLNDLVAKLTKENNEMRLRR